MRITHLLAVGIASAGLAVAGCGGGDSDEDQIRAAISDVADDPATICEHMGQELSDLIGGEEQCKELADEAGASDESTDVDVKSVEIDGDTATATVSTEEDGEEEVSFAKEDGEWVFTSPPGAEAPEAETVEPETETAP